MNFKKLLEATEKSSGKGKLKWGRAKVDLKFAYLKMVLAQMKGTKTLRYSVYRKTKDYDLATILAISKAIHFEEPKTQYRTLIYIDGLSKTKRIEYGSELRKLGIPAHKVKGITKDENNPMIRLADSIAGWIRDVLEGEIGELKSLYDKAIANKTLIPV